ncbi:hypothetical protein [Thioflexithrix psekupsensis]|uniref:Uncharacterized protein n=1 Tax=Thioflexithrix psekupsensis TaxID=1570016 RepID=A0A251XC19_9GAMM|nr:hypothetical protein [Thioflexithrix psekupsensis]OUD16204.1 hypothetical protein TPSD3_00305 [Thioflexithrix psekupsensis]
MSDESIYLLLSIIVLSLLLFPFVTRLIWILSVRRLQRKWKRELNEIELKGQLQRARIISLFFVLFFSFLFNVSLLYQN